MLKSSASKKIKPSRTHKLSSTLPQKVDPKQVWITVGRNLIDYWYKLITCTANMVSAKIMWNSVISSPGAKFGGADIKTCILKHLSIDTSTCKCPQAFSRWNWPLQSVGESHLWLCIHGDSMQHVRLTTSRHLGKQAPMTNARVSIATSKYNTRPVFGSTSHTPSSLICESRILESHTSAMTVSNTSLLHYALRHMKLLRIGLLISTVASISSGTISNLG